MPVAHDELTEDEKTVMLQSAVNSAIPTLERWQMNLSDLGAEHKWIGNGGYSDVYKATLHGGSSVALKKFRTAGDCFKRLQAVSTLLREVTIVAAISHRNIVGLVGYHLSADLEDAWLITAWQANGVVTVYIAATLPNLKRRLELAHDTAKALAFLHSLDPPVCHGDIKPDNALVGEDGVVRLCDLGLAATLDDSGTGLTTSRVANGLSFAYSSPERVEGQPRSREADVWAWGCLFLEIAEGQKPYEAYKDLLPFVRAIMDGMPPARLEAGKHHDISIELTQRCWERIVDRRITMAECEERLNPLQGSAATAAAALTIDPGVSEASDQQVQDPTEGATNVRDRDKHVHNQGPPADKRTTEEFIEPKTTPNNPHGQTGGAGFCTEAADYWQLLYNAGKRRVEQNCVEDRMSKGTSIWTATVMYMKDDGEILSWTKHASEKRAARNAAALLALEALKIPINPRY